MRGALGLGDHVTLFLGCGQVGHLLGDLAGLHFPIRSLDEPEPVHTGKRGQRTDQSDVGAFWRLDRAHPSVVGRVHISHLEPSALTRQPTRAQRRKTATVGEPGQGVRLVHELAKLTRPEELLDRGNDRTDV